MYFHDETAACFWYESQNISCSLTNEGQASFSRLGSGEHFVQQRVVCR